MNLTTDVRTPAEKLHEAIEQAKGHGMTKESVVNVAEQVFSLPPEPEAQQAVRWRGDVWIRTRSGWKNARTEQAGMSWASMHKSKPYPALLVEQDEASKQVEELEQSLRLAKDRNRNQFRRIEELNAKCADLDEIRACAIKDRNDLSAKLVASQRLLDLRDTQLDGLEAEAARLKEQVKRLDELQGVAFAERNRARRAARQFYKVLRTSEGELPDSVWNEIRAARSWLGE